jgi:hypothetical protein
MAADMHNDDSPEQPLAAGSVATDSTGNVSFSELARVHLRWAQRFHQDKASAERARGELDRVLKSFQSEQGQIVDAYWCTSDASAVALTEKPQDPPPKQPPVHLRRLQPPDPVWRLHRVTDWVTFDYLPIAELLHHCDTLAIKVECVLEGTPRRVAMRWLFSVEENLLGFVERMKLAAGQASNGGESVSGKQRRQSELDKFVAKQRKEILQIEDYYDRAGQKRARQVYVTGMGIGFIGLIPVAVATAALLSVFHVLDLHAAGIRTFFACMAAGALGAIVSVLSRMAGRRGGFVVDHEIGHVGIRRLGSYRPLIGATFGLAIYFLARTTLLHLESGVRTFPFFVTVAFLAGFSERWAQVVLGGAEQTVKASLGVK